MSFIVTGLSQTGLTVIDCDTALQALEKAAELVRTGHVDVLIAGNNSVQYTADEFSRLFRG